MLAALAAGRSLRRAGSQAACSGSLQLRGAADLAFEELSSATGGAAPPESEPATALLIHGLLGQGRNWRTWGRAATKDASAQTGRWARV